MTRSDADIQTANFDSGAEMNAYYNVHDGEAIGKTPTILTASAVENNKNRLSPDVQPYYPSEDNVDIMALYPRERANKNITTFTVEPNQIASANYKLSDLMWAGITNQSRTTEDVNLQFSHLMAKMSIIVEGKEGVLVKSVTLMNVIRNINISELSAAQYQFEIGTETDADKKTILLANTSATEVNNTLSGSVLFPPQTISGEFIKVETNYGNAYYSTINKTFNGGEAYSASIVVKRQDIGFTTTITDWKSNGASIAVPPGSSAGLKIGHIDDIPYDGTQQTPALTITYTPNDNLGSEFAGNTYDLVLNKDYKADYFNNTNQGTAMVIITGLKSPDRTGTQEPLADIIAQIKSMTSFNITAANGLITYNGSTAATKEVEYDYNTTVDFQLEKNGGDGKFTYTSSDPSVADVTISGIVTIRKVGSTRITANMDNSGNYSAATAYYDLKVNPRSLKNAKERSISLYR